MSNPTATRGHTRGHLARYAPVALAVLGVLALGGGAASAAATAAQCSTLWVPLDWSRPGGTEVKVALSRLRATDRGHRAGSVYVTEGVGRCQRRGGEIEVIRPGDRVYFEPDEEHWHGAAPDRFMTHIAMQETDDSGSPVTWGTHVSDEEYGGAPAA